MNMASLLDNLRIAIEEWLWSVGATNPPFSSIFFIFVTLFMSLISNALNHLLIDMKTMSKEADILARHQKDKKEAMRSGDTRLWIKVQRQEPMIQELQQKSMMTKLLPQIITYGPIIFIFTTLRLAFQAEINTDMNLWGPNGTNTCTNSCGGVVVFPFRIPDNFPIFGKWTSPYSQDPDVSIAGYGFWYFISAIATSTFFQKVLGINLSRNPSSRNQIM